MLQSQEHPGLSHLDTFGIFPGSNPRRFNVVMGSGDVFSAYG